jgi:hypothetical protein
MDDLIYELVLSDFQMTDFFSCVCFKDTQLVPKVTNNVVNYSVYQSMFSSDILHDNVHQVLFKRSCHV